MTRDGIRGAVRQALAGQERGQTMGDLRGRAKYSGDTTAFAQVVCGLVKAGEVVKHSGETPRTSTYSLNPEFAGDDKPARASRKPRAGKRKAATARRSAPKGKRSAPAVKRRAAAVPPPAPRLDMDFSVSSLGALRIAKGNQVVDLGAGEFEALREFINRSCPIWEAVSGQ